MTTGVIGTLPKKQFFDNNGHPAVGYKLYTYLAGTTTNATTYQDQALGSANTNPITLDARGECDLWLDPAQEYKLVLKTAGGTIIWTQDDVSGALSSADTLAQLQSGSANWLTAVAGTNTITATATPTPTAYAAGQTFRLTAANSNTGAVTLNVSTLGAITAKKRMAGGLVDLVANDLIIGNEYDFTYDGTVFVLSQARPYSHGADVASAATINLNSTTGDLVDVTGTTTITAITLAEGEQRTLRFTGALTLTNGASLVIPGGANITTAAGDFAVVRGYASGVVRVVAYTRADGTPIVSASVKQIQPITASVAGNALTLTLNATSLDFRSSSLTSGTVNTRTVASPISVTVSSGSTLGTANGVAARLVVLAIDNAGTVELAVVNLAGGNNLDETTLISTTAEGGAGAADSANVIYSTTARSNVPFRVVGFVDITEATAGTWASAPTTIQGQGGEALSALQSMGYGQTVQNVAASRANATTYTNTTGKPIFVNVSMTSAANGNSTTATVGGVSIIGSAAQTAGNSSAVAFMVPPGVSYSVTITSFSTITSWVEVR